MKKKTNDKRGRVVNGKITMNNAKNKLGLNVFKKSAIKETQLMC